MVKKDCNLKMKTTDEEPFLEIELKTVDGSFETILPFSVHTKSLLKHDGTGTCQIELEDDNKSFRILRKKRLD